MTNEEAEEMLGKLEEHYREPVRRVTDYCKALEKWSKLAVEQKIIERFEFSNIRLSISKSCLLKRMIYMGEPLRTRRCPIHAGRWSGCFAEPCPAGCDTCGCACGWLPEDAKVAPEWGWAFWLASALEGTYPGRAFKSPPEMAAVYAAQQAKLFGQE